MSAEFGSLTITLGIEGDRIYGEGSLEVHCPHDRMGAELLLEGQVSPDGTFTLRNVYQNVEDPAGSVVIRGKLPAKGTTEWQGQFSSSLRGQNGSCVPVTSDIVGTQLPTLKGTFSGTVRAGDGMISEIVMQVDQRELISTNSTSPGFTHCVPINVILTVKNASGPLWGIFTKTPELERQRCNRLGGSRLLLEFPSTDGATLHAFGSLYYQNLIVDRIHLTLDYFPKDLSKPGSQVLHAMGTLKRQAIMHETPPAP